MAKKDKNCQQNTTPQKTKNGVIMYLDVHYDFCVK